MHRLTKREGKHTVRIGNEWRRHDPVWDKLAYYEDLEESGNLVILDRTNEPNPCTYCNEGYLEVSLGTLVGVQIPVNNIKNGKKEITNRGI